MDLAADILRRRCAVRKAAIKEEADALKRAEECPEMDADEHAKLRQFVELKPEELAATLTASASVRFSYDYVQAHISIPWMPGSVGQPTRLALELMQSASWGEWASLNGSNVDFHVKLNRDSVELTTRHPKYDPVPTRECPDEIRDAILAQVDDAKRAVGYEGTVTQAQEFITRFQAFVSDNTQLAHALEVGRVAEGCAGWLGVEIKVPFKENYHRRVIATAESLYGFDSMFAPSIRVIYHDNKFVLVHTDFDIRFLDK